MSDENRVNNKANAKKDTLTLTQQELQSIIDSAVKQAIATQESSSDSFILNFLQKPTSFLTNLYSFLRNRNKNMIKIDDFGFDEGLFHQLEPIMDFFFSTYWNTKIIGIENVPSEGKALLVANHSGTLPFDAMMISTAIQRCHPNPRIVRFLYLTLFASTPFINIFLSRMGHVVANPDNAIDLLNRGELTGVFPEGVKGIGKAFSERYRLARFGRGGFIKIAIQTGAPIIPVAVIGAEEIYPMIAKSEILSKIFHLPYFPITPTFPWLGILGLLPLPSNWTIVFGEPISFKGYKTKDADNDILLLALGDQVRNKIQSLIISQLKKRRSAFFE